MEPMSKEATPKIDYAVDKIDAVNAFLRQGTEENIPYEESEKMLIRLFS